MDFEQSSDQSATPPQTNTTDPLEALVGEGKPFKDIAALASSKIEADGFIEQLKSENFQMREAVKKAEDKLSRASTTTEILDAVRGMQTQGQTNEPLDTSDEDKGGNQSILTKETIAELIQSTISKTEQDKTKEANYQSVKDAFVEAFKDPDKARLQYKAAAVALEMTEEQLDSYAKQNPTLVLQAAGLKPAFKSTTAPPDYVGQGHQNSDANLGTVNTRDHAWWESQRKDKGNTWYFSTKTQQMYWDDAKALGDSFLP
jgi:hypothetical protein